MTFVIRSDIPIPFATRGSKYPIAHLEVGECFIVPADQLPPRGANSIRAAVASYKKSSKSVKVRGADDGRWLCRSMAQGIVPC
jgi:hypothetical protein